jgi:hypothetical protein
MNILYIVLPIFIMISSISMQDQKILFDGVSLDGWELIDYTGHGDVYVADSTVIIGAGKEISGIRWTGDFPKSNFEVTLDAKRVKGSDFFLGMTFPVKESYMTLVLGGWGGSVTGLSSIDGYDAADNSTGSSYNFKQDQWYKVRLRVTDEMIEAWVDKDYIVGFRIDGSYLSLRWEMDSSVPFGLTTYRTLGAMKNIRLSIIGE